jgi:hypothetical protein
MGSEYLILYTQPSFFWGRVLQKQNIQGGFFTLLTGFTALRFTAADAPLAARRIRILPMAQHADNICNEEKLK